LLVGNTTGTSQFDVRSSANKNTAKVQADSASQSNNVLQVTGARGTTNGSYILLACFNAGAGNQFNVLDSGNAQNTNNSYGGLSDIKLKENIVDATPKLEKLNQVRVVNYNLKDNSEQKLIGVVAQELEQIFPSMIDETPDRDVEGNDLGTTTKSVKYSVFVPMLIKAIQEQQAIINDLKARIETLESK
jgi:hypothetical protein